jgi:hypothetical protein
VPGNLQVDRISRGLVGEIGFVSEQNDGLVRWYAAQSFEKVSTAAENIVHARQPEPGSIGFNGLRLIGQDMDIFSFEGTRHVPGVGAFIVIAHDGPKPMRRGELTQYTGARFSRQCAFGVVTQQRHRNKIAGKHNQIGSKADYDRDSGMKRMNREMRIVVKIAKHGDGETIHSLGPARQKKILPHQAGMIGGEERGVPNNDGRTRNGRCGNELASCGWKKRQTNSFWGSRECRKNLSRSA